MLDSTFFFSRNYAYDFISFFKFFSTINFYFILISLLFLSVVFYFTEYNFLVFYKKNHVVKKYIRFLLLVQILISFFFFLFSFFSYLYVLYTHSNLYINHNYYFPKLYSFLDLDFYFFNLFSTSLNFSIDFFGYSLIFLAYTVGLISLSILDTRIYWKNIKYLYTFNIFVLVVYFYASVSNLLLFFFFYEALLLPSFLFVYFISPSKRAVQASIYFIIWTQIGSVLVLIVFSYLTIVLNVYNFFSLKFVILSNIEAFFLYFLLFLGFGFKVPIWPFHYWLTKTHVEAPSGFSIYLSGFLVKSALFGFYKISSSFLVNVDTTIFLVLCFFSVFDSSLKMWGQTDLKKIAAYGTIQEMNLIYMALVLGDVFSIYCAVLFVLTHAYLSAFMFFMVDCIYKRFHTRSIVSINGIFSLCPNLAISILVMLVCFSGLPGTVKYTVEFLLFGGLMEYSLLFCFLIMVTANILGLIGFSKNWFNAIFGLKIKKVTYAVLDLTAKELLIVCILVFFLFYFSFFLNYFLM